MKRGGGRVQARRRLPGSEDFHGGSLRDSEISDIAFSE
jgi:hypothetical protein